VTAVNTETPEPVAAGAGVMDGFHPAVRAWFSERFAGGPTAAQVGAWPAIRAGSDTLVSAPTGSGKTLSAFLVAIDALWQAHERGEQVAGQAQVVYVSPLKALATDIAENLTAPLAEIERIGRDGSGRILVGGWHGARAAGVSGGRVPGRSGFLE